jgi:hypothetical protein
VAIVAPPQPALQFLLPYPALRLIAAWLPAWALPAMREWGMVVQLSPEGHVLRMLMDPGGRHVSHVSGIAQHGNRLFLGNLAKDYVSVINL